MREVRLKDMVRLNIYSRTNWRTPFRVPVFTKCISKYFLVCTTKYRAILLGGNVFDCHSDILFLPIMSGVAILRTCIKPHEVPGLQGFVLLTTRSGTAARQYSHTGRQFPPTSA